MRYDALLILSFGGPEGPADVRPFLERVTRGRNVPAARLDEAASHYDRFGGVSPIGAATRALADAVRAAVDVPVYLGNRNWHPLVEDTVAAMAADGIGHAACFATSAFGGYSACRQYLEDIARARTAAGSKAPAITKLPPFYDRDGFVEPVAANVRAALASLGPPLATAAHLAFTAHSVPVDQPGADTYAGHVETAVGLVRARVGGDQPWSLSWQSRSGPATQPWLSPSLDSRLAALEPGTAVVVVPIGFVADHMEVVYDLDVEAASQAASRGLVFTRAATVGVAPVFVRMIVAMVAEPPPPSPDADCGAAAILGGC